MRLFQQLAWGLTEMKYLRFDALPFNRIFDPVDINGTFVSEIIEHIVSFHSFFALLFVAENKI